MNRIYRIVFNRTLGVPQVVSELASAPGGAVGGATSQPRLGLKSRMLAAAVGLALAAVALPTWAQTCVPSATVICGVNGGTGAAGNTSSGGGAGGAGAISSGGYANSGGAGANSGNGSPGHGAGGSGGSGGGASMSGGPGAGGSGATQGVGGGGGGGASWNGYGGGGGGGGGGVGQSVAVNTAFTNPGAISGGNGGNGGNGGFAFSSAYGGGGGGGGAGVYAANGSTITSGAGTTITGGIGGNGGGGFHAATGGGGGAGVAGNGSTLNTAGTITGGAGGNGGGQVSDGGTGGGGGVGGMGISGTSLTLMNTGTVNGGAGGNGANDTQTGGNGGAGGAALSLSQSSLNNAGTISGGKGGAGGTGSSAGATGVGGVGITGSNLAVINSGTINGGLSGTGTRAAAITFTGGTNSLELDSGSTITGNVVAVAGGNDTLALGGSSTGTTFDVANIGGQYLNFKNFLKSGISTWTLTGTSAAVTPWTISGGILSISSDASLGAASGGLAFNGGTLEATASMTSSRAVTLDVAGGSISTDTGMTLTETGVISGAGSLNTLGGGELVLTGASTYTGATTINTGSTLALIGTGSIASSSDVIANGTFDISNTTGGASIVSLDGGGNVNLGAQSLSLTNATGTFSGVISGSGSLSVSGNAEYLLGANTYTGGTTIGNNAGLYIGNQGTTGSIVGDVTDNGRLFFAHTDAITYDGVISGSGQVYQYSSGTVTLTGASTYTGSTVIYGGTLALSGNGSIANSDRVIDLGTFDISSTTDGASINSLYGSGGGSGNVNLGAQTLTLTNAFDEFDGVITGSGGLTVAAGGETLGGVNSYAGATNINNVGTLALTGTGSIASSSDVIANGTFDISNTTNGASINSLVGTGNVNLGAQTLTLTNAFDEFDGVIAGSGGLTVAAGSETLGGVNSYTGATAIYAGGTLALTGTGSIGNSSDVIANGMFDISNTTGGASIVSLVGNGNVNLGAQSLSLTNASGNFSGVISGSGGLNVAGPIESLTGDNTYTGVTTIANGTDLVIGNQGTTGSIVGDVIDNGYLLFDRSDAVTYAGAVSGTGGVYQYDAIGSLTLTGVNTFTGNAVIFGTLALSGNGSVADAYNVIDDGTFDISNTTNGASITSLNGNSNGNVNLGAQTLTLTNAFDEFDGVIAGSGGLTVAAGGETLGGVNSYTGATAINAGGMLALTGTGSIGNSSNVIANGTFDISNTTGGASIVSLDGNGNVNLGAQSLSLTNADGYFSGVISGSGGLNVAGPIEFLTGDNTYTGVTTIANDTDLVIGDQGTTGSIVGDVVNNGYLLFDLSDAVTYAGAVSGTGGVYQYDAIGSLTLTGVNTFTGNAVIFGTLALSGNGSVADAYNVIDDGTFDISNTTNGASITSLNGNSNGNVNLGAQTLTLTNAFDEFDGVIAGSGGLTVAAGSETLGGVNSYTGATAIYAGGTLALTGTGSIGNSSDVIANGMFDISNTTGGASIVSLVGNGNVNLGAQSLSLTNASGTFKGVIAGSGGLVIAAGQQVLDGVNTYTGATTVQGGTLLVGDSANATASIAGDASVENGATLGGFGSVSGNVDVANGAHLAPGGMGSLGTLTVGGNLNVAQGGILDYAFGAPGSDFTTAGTGDSVKVGGNLELDGAVLNVTDAGGFGAGLYNLFTYGGTLTETNGGITLGSTPSGSTLSIQNLTTDKQINLLNTTGLTLNFWNANGLASSTQMGGGSGTWTVTSPNWTDATGSVSAPMLPQPSFGIFGGAAGTVTVDNGAGAVSATGLQFASDGYTLNGGTLTLVGSGGVAPIIRVGDGSTAGAGFTATIDNVLAGTDGLTKSDLGTLVLTAANTYSGGTAVVAGTLEVANNAALGTDGVTVDNTANAGATLKIDSGINVANAIAINNGGTLDNAGTISHTGATDIGVNATGGMATVINHDGGSITGGVIGLWLHTGGTVVNTGSTSSIGGINYAIVTDGSPSSVTNQNGASIQSSMTDAVLMIQGGTLTNDTGANISGNVGVRMSQIGTVINQGGASINGTTNVNGTGIGVVLMAGGTVTNQGGASIDGTSTGVAFQGNSTLFNAAGSSISGPDASVQAFGSGTFSLTNAGALSGNVVLNDGAVNTVTLLSGSTLNGSLYIGSNTGSSLTLDGTGAQLYSSAVTGYTNFSGTLTKQGTGTWIIDQDLAPTNTVINVGTLQIGNGGTSGSLGGDITDNAALVTNLSGAGTLAGVISGSGSLTQSGSGVMTLTGANTYTGGTTINAGTLQLGIGGTSGSITGNVTDNATLAFDRSDVVSFGGVISGHGALAQDGSGTLVLTGDNTYTGGTTIGAGTLQIGNGGTTGAIIGNVTDNGALAFDHSDTVTFGNVISGTGHLAQAGSGSLILTGANTYTGGTTIGAGTLQIGTGGTAGAIIGNVTDNGALAFDHSDTVTFGNVISGTGLLAQAGSGSLILTGTNTYTGGTSLKAGALVLGNASAIGSGALAMAAGTTLSFSSGFTLANAITLSGDPTVNVGAGLSTTLSGGISNGTQAGDLVKTGAGTLLLTGADTYTGSTEVATGTLEVVGSLASSVSVDNGATLTGTGSTGNMTIASGALVSPGGDGVGTLTVNGNVSMASGSSYQVNATDTGSNDLIHATGTATLGGGSVIALEAGSNWNVSTKYTILTANSGVSGTFGGSTSNFAFLTPTLSYDANDAYLTLARNTTAFASVGVTPNEIHTAAAIESTSSSAVYNAILPLAAGPAQAAFATLAGDNLASTRTAIVDDSHYVRDAINNHLQGVQGTGETVQQDDQGSVWVSTWGHGGSQDSDGNAAAMSSTGSGVLVGTDRELGTWRVGAVAGSGQLSNSSTEGAADAHSTDTVLGLYTGVDLGAWQLQGGAAHSWYTTRSHRQIDVAGIAGSETARYDNSVTQTYVDGGYQFTFARSSLTPFVDLARVWIHQGAINEGGGAAALDVQANGSSVNYGTAGVRGVFEPSPGLQLHASVGFQHAWGDLQSINQQQFAGGSDSFTVAGLPVAMNAGIFDLGIRFALSKNVTVDASYHGQFSNDATDQGARMSLNVAF